MAQTTPEILRRVDAYVEALCAPEDEALKLALADSGRAGLPQISVSANEGKLLHLLAKIAGARRILEIGLLGGYSAIWLARALPAGGRMISLELEEKHARVARANLDRAGVGGKVEIRTGPALESLQRMLAEGEAPFDVIFIDADKTGYPAYLDCAFKLVKPGSLILGDNVIRNGRVADGEPGDASLDAIRTFNRRLAEDPRLDTLLLPLMRDSLDGLAIARVK